MARANLHLPHPSLSLSARLDWRRTKLTLRLHSLRVSALSTARALCTLCTPLVTLAFLPNINSSVIPISPVPCPVLPLAH